MPKSFTLKTLGAAAVCAMALLVPATVSAQDAGEKAMWARQGFMNLVSWSAGPLFGMAKGDVAYDPAAAQTRAGYLQALYQLPFPELFVDGTSKADRPGKTRALPEIWSDRAGFEAKFAEIRAAVSTVAAEAGKGQAELAAAVGAMGKVCGGCYNTYRAKEY